MLPCLPSGAVAIHPGDLTVQNTTLEECPNVRVLVLTGAIDSSIPDQELIGLIDELEAAQAIYEVSCTTIAAMLATADCCNPAT